MKIYFLLLCLGATSSFAGGNQTGGGNIPVNGTPNLHDYELSTGSELFRDAEKLAEAQLGEVAAASLKKKTKSLKWYLVPHALSTGKPSFYSQENQVILSKGALANMEDRSQSVTILWQAALATARDPQMKKEMEATDAEVLKHFAQPKLIDNKRLYTLRRWLKPRAAATNEEDGEESVSYESIGGTPDAGGGNEGTAELSN